MLGFTYLPVLVDGFLEEVLDELELLGLQRVLYDHEADLGRRHLLAVDVRGPLEEEGIQVVCPGGEIEREREQHNRSGQVQGWATVYVLIFAVVLFSRMSRVRPSQKFPLQFMSTYSNTTIRKITKLSLCEFPHLVQSRENICTRKVWRIQY